MELIRSLCRFLIDVILLSIELILFSIDSAIGARISFPKVLYRILRIRALFIAILFHPLHAKKKKGCLNCLLKHPSSIIVHVFQARGRRI